MRENKMIAGLGFVTILLWVAVIAAWLTHVVTCILAHAWILLIVGAFIAPIGVIHGIMVWLGFPAV